MAWHIGPRKQRGYIGAAGALRYLNNRIGDLDALRRLLAGGDTLAWHQPGVGVTGTLAATAWETQLGGFGPLLETGGSGPINLPFTGTKYAYLPGVAGNHFSTPDSAANSITGDIDIRIYMAADNWKTPAADSQKVATKANAAPNISWLCYINSNLGAGKPLFGWSADGTNFVDSGPIECSAAVTFTAGQAATMRYTLDVDNGAGGYDLKFWTSTDYNPDTGVGTWTQLGTTVTGASATSIANTNAPVQISSYNGAAGDEPYAGKVYRVQVYDGIGGTLVNDLNPALSAETMTNGATFTADTGEVWTLNSTGATPAQIVASPSMMFNGTTHTLLVAASVQAQPFTWYFTGTQITWTSLATIIGDRLNDLGVLQQGGSPNIGLGNTANQPTSQGIALGTKFVACAVWNGASSSVRLNMGAATIGNPGAAAMARFSVAARAGNISGNIQVNEIILRAGADSPATQFDIIRREMALHKIPA